MLQLKHGREQPQLPRAQHARRAVGVCTARACCSADDYEFFDASYRLLRTIEGRLRLMNSTARDDLPTDEVELAKLARALGYASGQSLLAQCRKCMAGTRERFERYFAAATQ